MSFLEHPGLSPVVQLEPVGKVRYKDQRMLACLAYVRTLERVCIIMHVSHALAGSSKFGTCPSLSLRFGDHKVLGGVVDYMFYPSKVHLSMPLGRGTHTSRGGDCGCERKI